MNTFRIREEKLIPYFDHKDSIAKTIKSSSKRRDINPILFSVKKIRNYILLWAAFFCPINFLRVKFNKWRGVSIGTNVYIGMGCIIDNAYPEYVYIEDDVALAGYVHIIAHVNPYIHFKKYFVSKVSPVLIRKGSWIAIRSTILPGTTIGKYSVILTNSVVNKNIPDYSIAIGNPIKIISKMKI